MTDLDEAVIAVSAAKRTKVPVVASMVFDSGPDKTRTMMGVTIEDAVAALTEAGADVIGANCGVGIDHYLVVCQRLRNATSLPVWIKANAGLPEYADGKVTYAETPEHFASKAMEICAAGANFVGGCCGRRRRSLARLPCDSKISFLELTLWSLSYEERDGSASVQVHSEPFTPLLFIREGVGG